MIRVENVSKSFGHLQVLDSVSLQVEDATVVSITGASGAGKTTLLQIMGSLDRGFRNSATLVSASCSSSITFCRNSLLWKMR